MRAAPPPPPMAPTEASPWKMLLEPSNKPHSSLQLADEDIKVREGCHCHLSKVTHRCEQQIGDSIVMVYAFQYKNVLAPLFLSMLSLSLVHFPPPIADRSGFV